MPVFNAAGTVARAIDSVRGQEFADWELIVVDDGSIDATRDIVQAFARADPRVRVWHRSHEGIAATLNAGLVHARGEFVARMDADDTAHPERLGVQLAFLRAPENAAIGLVACEVDFGGPAALSAGYALHVAWQNELHSPGELRLNRFVESPLAHPSVMFRRDLVERHGAYRDGDFPEDYELWLRWMDAGVCMAKVPRRLLTWNDAAGRLSRTHPRYSPEAFFRAKAPYLVRELTRVARGRAVWVWGAGRPTRKRVAELERAGVTVAGFIDIDPKKQRARLGGTGRPVIGPEAIATPGQCFVLGCVGKRGAREWHRDHLRTRGFTEGQDFLMCA